MGKKLTLRSGVSYKVKENLTAKKLFQLLFSYLFTIIGGEDPQRKMIITPNNRSFTHYYYHGQNLVPSLAK